MISAFCDFDCFGTATDISFQKDRAALLFARNVGLGFDRFRRLPRRGRRIAVEFFELAHYVSGECLIHRFDGGDDGLLIARNRDGGQLVYLDLLVFNAAVVVEGIFEWSKSDAHGAHQSQLDFTPCGIEAIFQLTFWQCVRLWDRGLKGNAFGRRLAENGLANRLIAVMLMEKHERICEARAERINGVLHAITCRRRRPSREGAFRSINRLNLKDRIGALVVCHARTSEEKCLIFFRLVLRLHMRSADCHRHGDKSVDSSVCLGLI